MIRFKCIQYTLSTKKYVTLCAHKSDHDFDPKTGKGSRSKRFYKRRIRIRNPTAKVCCQIDAIIKKKHCNIVCKILPTALIYLQYRFEPGA